MKEIKKILKEIKNEDIDKFLSYIKDITDTPGGAIFNYKYIKIDNIKNIIKKQWNKKYMTINININQTKTFNEKKDNPIFWWIFDKNHIFIYDFKSFSSDIINKKIFDLTEDEYSYIIETFKTQNINKNNEQICCNYDGAICMNCQSQKYGYDCDNDLECIFYNQES